MGLDRLDALAGEWGSVPALLEAVANVMAAEAGRRDSGTGRRATDALRRVAAAMRTEADVSQRSRSVPSDERPPEAIRIAVSGGLARVSAPGFITPVHVDDGESLYVWQGYLWEREEDDNGTS